LGLIKKPGLRIIVIRESEFNVPDEERLAASCTVAGLPFLTSANRKTIDEGDFLRATKVVGEDVSQGDETVNKSIYFHWLYVFICDLAQVIHYGRILDTCSIFLVWTLRQ
jgi:hypothetical protein